MSNHSPVRFAMIGGFLGAGKTTLLGQIASRYAAQGKRVGLITNDQAADLVDTAHLRSLGFTVGEVSGACFCCSFDHLIETADSLGGQNVPDLLLAEPVGSCTDLVATVVLPMQQQLGERFRVSPFGVLLKPSHGQRILAADEGKRSGFSPQAEYIFRKQLEEADYLMIGRSDQLSSEQIQLLCERLSIAAPGVPVLAISPRTGEGVDQVIEMIQSDTLPGGRLLDIDYDVYADGEAELGWVNLAATLDLESEIDPDEMVQQLLRRMAAVIATSAGNPGETGPPEIAHLKASVRGDDVQAVANVVDSSGGVDVGLLAGRPVGGSIQLLVNARVAMDPSELEHIVRQQVGAWVTTHAARCENLHANALRPGRPTPTHRVTVKG